MGASARPVLSVSPPARSTRARLATTMPETVITPVVRVPVLSSTIVSTRRVCSSTWGPRSRMPSCEPRPVPTRSAVGVASPRAQGHAMMSVATAAVKATSREDPKIAQARKVAIARPMTTGTKMAETRSAMRCTFALPVWASSTRRPRRASSVSAPTRVTSTTRRPLALMVAPTTRSPTVTSTGTDSPVSRLASTADVPSTTIPSVAIFSPGRTTNRSPGTSAATATVDSTPSRSSVASRAPSSSRARIAAPDSPLARASK